MTDPLERVLSRLDGVQRAGTGHVARCPAHEDRRASLSVSRGSDARVLLKCHAGCTIEAIVGALGLRMADLFSERNGAPLAKPRVVTRYDYQNERGELLFQVERLEPKGFRQRRPGPDGTWVYSLDGVRRVPYRLPELLAAPKRAVFVVEGEKDVENLERLGLLATTSPQGAGKWSKLDAAAVEFAFRDRVVVIVPDKDDPGRAHARDVARSLFDLAKSVRILELPGDRVKDTSDWVDAGGTRQELERLAREAPVLTAPPEEPAKRVADVRREEEGEVGDAIDAEAAARLLYQPPPIHALPRVLGEYVTRTAKALGCDAGHVLPHVLAAVSGALGLARRARVSARWVQPGTIWEAVVAPPGSMKSPPWQEAMRPLRVLQRARIDAAAPAMAEYRRRKREYERLTRKGNPDPGEEPTRPQEPRILVDDVTVEALAPILADNPRGLLLASEELHAWLGGLNQYRGGRGADGARWCGLFDGGGVSVDRKTGEPRTIILEHAAVGVSGTIQPAILRASMSPSSQDAAKATEMIGSGLIARLLLCAPPAVVLESLPADVPDLPEYAQILGRTHELAMGVDVSGRPTPIDLALTPEARRVLEDWLPEQAEWVRELDEEAPLRGALAKLRGTAVRLALLVHVAAWAESEAVMPGPIGPDAMRAGIELVRWWKRELERVYAMVLGGMETLPRRVLRLVRWLEARPDRRGTPRDAARYVRAYSGQGGTDAAEQDLRRLAAAGLVAEEAPRPREGPGRPPPPVFVLCCADTIRVSRPKTAIVSADPTGDSPTEGRRGQEDPGAPSDDWEPL